MRRKVQQLQLQPQHAVQSCRGHRWPPQGGIAVKETADAFQRLTDTCRYAGSSAAGATLHLGAPQRFGNDAYPEHSAS